MKRLILLLLLLGLFLAGCIQQPQITESEAIVIIEELHTNSFGDAEVLSIEYNWGAMRWSGRTQEIANRASIMSMGMMAAWK